MHIRHSHIHSLLTRSVQGGTLDMIPFTPQLTIYGSLLVYLRQKLVSEAQGYPLRRSRHHSRLGRATAGYS